MMPAYPVTISAGEARAAIYSVCCSLIAVGGFVGGLILGFVVL